jgi:hypothetical protein
MNGVTIADFSPGDSIILTGVSFDSYSFSLSGNTLNDTGGSPDVQRAAERHAWRA